MEYWFYLSYARTNTSEYLKRFYNDLCESLGQRIGISRHNVGFFDEEGIQVGENWPETIVNALQHSRVFIPLFSPAYFNSEYCGKEWQFFRSREKTLINTLPPTTRYRSLIMPILWVPESYLPKTLPATVLEVQYNTEEFGAEYMSNGLMQLMKVSKYRDAYEEFIFRFTGKLYDTATAHQLLPIENAPSFKEITSAFTNDSKPHIWSVVTEEENLRNQISKDNIPSTQVKRGEALEAVELSESISREKSNIFISYRRNDSEGFAGRLFDQLSGHFGVDQVFMDIDTIEPGEDFIEVIEKAVSSCHILIAIIGKGWLTTTDEKGQRRLENQEDFVRVEISTALKRNIRVIPVLVQGAAMPQSNELPDALTKLARRNAFELSSSRWKYDVGKLIQVIEKVLGSSKSV